MILSIMPTACLVEHPSALYDICRRIHQLIKWINYYDLSILITVLVQPTIIFFKSASRHPFYLTGQPSIDQIIIIPTEPHNQPNNKPTQQYNHVVFFSSICF